VEGALGEFAGTRAARAELEAAIDQRLDDDGAAMALQLEDVFARVRVRAGEEERDADIDCVARHIEERRELRVARHRQLTDECRGNLRRFGSRHAHHSHAAAAGRSRCCHDGVGMAHARPRVPSWTRMTSLRRLFCEESGRASICGQRLREAFSAAIFRLMFHC
jgi:hypothetical protein